jgi:tRNASer (uridine44-2'-O)-methyltransferase
LVESFIDLGCGNGLLVYLLTQEGFKGGVGLDLRRRKIWDFFQKEGTDLRMETFEPKPEPLLRNYEWVYQIRLY